MIVERGNEGLSTKADKSAFKQSNFVKLDCFSTSLQWPLSNFLLKFVDKSKIWCGNDPKVSFPRSTTIMN